MVKTYGKQITVLALIIAAVIVGDGLSVGDQSLIGAGGSIALMVFGFHLIVHALSSKQSRNRSFLSPTGKVSVERLLAFIMILTVAEYVAVHVPVYLRSAANLGWLYVFRACFPTSFPPILYGAYIFLRGQNKFRRASKIVFYLSIISLTVLVVGYAFSSSVYFNFGTYEWSWAAVIEWNFTFVFAYALIRRKTEDFGALAFATAAISAGGMIYELPIYRWGFLTRGIFDAAFPLFIDTAFISLAFIIYFLKLHNWRPKWFYVCLIIYLAHFVYYGIVMDYPGEILGWWLPRIPGIILLLGLTEIKKESNGQIIKQ